MQPRLDSSVPAVVVAVAVALTQALACAGSGGATRADTRPKTCARGAGDPVTAGVRADDGRDVDWDDDRDGPRACTASPEGGVTMEQMKAQMRREQRALDERARRDAFINRSRARAGMP